MHGSKATETRGRRLINRYKVFETAAGTRASDIHLSRHGASKRCRAIQRIGLRSPAAEAANPITPNFKYRGEPRGFCTSKADDEGSIALPPTAIDAIVQIQPGWLRRRRSAGQGCRLDIGAGTNMRCLIEEPGPPLRIVDPVFEQACGSDVTIFVANGVHLTQLHRQLEIVLA
jgi:hypothetical protein